MLQMILGVFMMAQLSIATTDSIATVNIPYAPPHAEQSFEYLANNWDQPHANTQMFCMAERMFWDTVTSSALPAFQQLMAPYEIPMIPAFQKESIQINALYDGKIKVETNWDDFNQYVTEGANNDVWINEPKFTIDVSAYDQSTAAGRLEALVKAKLAVISLHYNLANRGFGLFRLDVEIAGLPQDQSEFTKDGFTPVYAKTQSPYSAPSPVARAYYNELISPEFCPDTLQEALGFSNN